MLKYILQTFFTIHGGNPTFLGDGGKYEHLGMPTGFHVAQIPSDSIISNVKDRTKSMSRWSFLGKT